MNPLPIPAVLDLARIQNSPGGENMGASVQISASAALPLCVDLDGTVLKTDSLFESLARLLRQKPWCLAMIPFWCFQGRARLKQQIGRRVSIDIELLPYHANFLEWLKHQKAQGRGMILATGADESVARSVASHLGIFDSVIASNGRDNLKGKRKLEAIRERMPEGFEYAGNARSDLKIWRHCSDGVAVGASPRVIQQAQESGVRVKVFPRVSSGLRHYARAMRCHQWAKNVLIYVPLLTSHQFTHPALLWKATLSALLFSLCSSAQYILNDLMDLDADRQHATKRSRPFASGDLPLQAGFIMAPLLLGVSLSAAWLLSPLFAAALALYFGLSLAYSLHIKRIILLDAFVLSGLYTIRIITGHLVTGIVFSVWLLSFAFFLFLSLAFSKRSTELNNAQKSNGTIVGRGYEIGDLPQVNVFGVCSSFLATVVFILYLQSDKVKELYQNPQLLWLLSPIFLYWVSRIWILSTRGKVSEDPVLFVLKDPVTYVIAAVCGLIMLLAKTNWLAMIAIN